MDCLLTPVQSELIHLIIHLGSRSLIQHGTNLGMLLLML
nr:MAG TPA: hypothetical protein [Bacteriophage sp.]